MNSLLLDKLKSIGFKTENTVSIGLFNDYPVSLVFSEETEEKQWCIGNIAVEQYNPNKLQKQLPKESQENKINFLTKGAQATSFSFIILELTQEKALETIETVLSLMTNLLSQNKISPQNKCCLCNQTDVDDYALYADATDNNTILARPIHVHCVKKEYNITMERVNSKTNPFICILYALIGALIGAIPTVLTIVFAKYEVAILEAIIPLAAFYGWRFAKGKSSTLAAIVVLIVSLFASISTYTISIMLIAKLPLNIMVFIEAFFIMMLKIDSNWFGLLCIVAVTIGTWKKMTESDADVAKNFEEMFMLRTESIKEEQKNSDTAAASMT